MLKTLLAVILAVVATGTSTTPVKTPNSPSESVNPISTITYAGSYYEASTNSVCINLKSERISAVDETYYDAVSLRDGSGKELQEEPGGYMHEGDKSYVTLIYALPYKFDELTLTINDKATKIEKSEIKDFIDLSTAPCLTCDGVEFACTGAYTYGDTLFIRWVCNDPSKAGSVSDKMSNITLYADDELDVLPCGYSYNMYGVATTNFEWYSDMSLDDIDTLNLYLGDSRATLVKGVHF